MPPLHLRPAPLACCKKCTTLMPSYRAFQWSAVSGRSKRGASRDGGLWSQTHRAQSILTIEIWVWPFQLTQGIIYVTVEMQFAHTGHERRKLGQSDSFLQEYLLSTARRGDTILFTPPPYYPFDPTASPTGLVSGKLVSWNAIIVTVQLPDRERPHRRITLPSHWVRGFPLRLSTPCTPESACDRAGLPGGTERKNTLSYERRFSTVPMLLQRKSSLCPDSACPQQQPISREYAPGEQDMYLLLRSLNVVKKEQEIGLTCYRTLMMLGYLHIYQL